MNSRTAVVALDLQRDFLEDGGRMPVARAHVDPLLASANVAIDGAIAARIPVVYVINAFPRSAWLPNLFRRGAAVAGSRGAEIDPRVHLHGDARFPKESSNAFRNPELDSFFKENGIGHLAIFGLFASACVRATVRGAVGRGYAVTLAEDGVADRSDTARARALAKLAKDGATIVPAGRFRLEPEA